jgi:hypothetical protein
MRVHVSMLALLLGLGPACGPTPDHPEAAPACDPQVMSCSHVTPITGSPTGSGNEAGAGSTDDELATFSGNVRAFNDDYFDVSTVFTGQAEVSATGESGARVQASYDGTSFELAGVLKDPANWFLTVPADGTGMIPTLMPLDTRSVAADMLSVGVANGSVVDSIFLASSGTERALERAQVVLHIVDEQLRSVPGVQGELTAEVTAYRAAGSWIGVGGQDVTDDSGMIFFGNVPAGSALSSAKIQLSGAATARVDLSIVAGAITVVTAVVSP